MYLSFVCFPTRAICFSLSNLLFPKSSSLHVIECQADECNVSRSSRGVICKIVLLFLNDIKDFGMNFRVIFCKIFDEDGDSASEGVASVPPLYSRSRYTTYYEFPKVWDSREQSCGGEPPFYPKSTDNPPGSDLKKLVLSC